jgi:hypothetical protein
MRIFYRNTTVKVSKSFKELLLRLPKIRNKTAKCLKARKSRSSLARFLILDRLYVN